MLFWSALATGSACILILLGLFFFLPQTTALEGFKTYTQIKEYAAALDEFPKMDNSNIIKPDYTTFWTKLSQTQGSQTDGFFSRRLERFLQFFHLRKKPVWSISFFKKQLEDLTKLRQEKGFVGNFVHKLIPNQGTQYLVVGDLQGAFHSLVCNVGKWIQLGFLNDDLKIIKPEARIVFVGNVVDRSHASIETLSLIMRLMQENPEGVFLLRGNHEYQNYWHDYGFKQELMVRAAFVSPEPIPLGDTVNKFFDTMTSAIYFGVQPNPTSTFVAIMHQGRDSEEKEMYLVDETKFQDFLKNADKNLLTFNLKEAKPLMGPLEIAIKAIVKSEKKRKTFQTMDGLRMLSPDKGASAWSFLSCPTTSYQEGVKFFFDAFGILEVGATIEQWTISLFNQDVRMRQGYQQKSYNLLTGASTTGGAGAVLEPESTPASPAIPTTATSRATPMPTPGYSQPTQMMSMPTATQPMPMPVPQYQQQWPTQQANYGYQAPVVYQNRYGQYQYPQPMNAPRNRMMQQPVAAKNTNQSMSLTASSVASEQGQHFTDFLQTEVVTDTTEKTSGIAFIDFLQKEVTNSLTVSGH